MSEERDTERDMETFHDILSAPIYTYRLTDGSYIVSEEIEIQTLEEDFEKENLSEDVLYCVIPGVLVFDQDGFIIKPWNITTTKDLTEIQKRNVVCRSEATYEVKLKYFEFMVGNRNLEPDEDSEYLDDLFEMFKDTFTQIESQSPAKESPYKKRWDWNPELN
jgi:hypothetical protein